MATAFVTHHDCSRHDTGWQHPEHQGRLPAVARAVYREMLTLHEVLREIEGVPAAGEDLRLAHSAEYVERVREAVAAAGAAGSSVHFDEGTRLSAASWDAVTAAAGCVVTAVEAVLRGDADNAFCSVRPPGSGAGRASAGRHAIFNNVAIAARHLTQRHAAGSVLIVEWGEHFGSGTAEIVARDPALRYLSVHARPRDHDDPCDRIVSRLLAPGAGCADLLDALASAAPAVLSGPRPAMILLSLGLDVLRSDPHGTLAVDPGDLYRLTRWTADLALERCDGRLVTALEGGFDAQASGAAVVHHLRALAGLPPA